MRARCVLAFQDLSRAIDPGVDGLILPAAQAITISFSPFFLCGDRQTGIAGFGIIGPDDAGGVYTGCVGVEGCEVGGVLEGGEVDIKQGNANIGVAGESKEMSKRRHCYLRGLGSAGFFQCQEDIDVGESRKCEVEWESTAEDARADDQNRVRRRFGGSGFCGRRTDISVHLNNKGKFGIRRKDLEEENGRRGEEPFRFFAITFPEAEHGDSSYLWEWGQVLQRIVIIQVGMHRIQNKSLRRERCLHTRRPIFRGSLGCRMHAQL